MPRATAFWDDGFVEMKPGRWTPSRIPYDAYQTVIHEELESPLHSATIGELESHFELRREAARGEPMHPLTQGFLRKGNDVFAAPRFIAMYHRWLKHGNAVFAGPSSTRDR